MKKLIFLLLFLFVPSTYAVSYNGSSLFNLPPVASGSTLYYSLGSNSNFTPTLDLGTGVPYRLINYNSVVRYKSGLTATTYTGILMNYEFIFDFGCNYNYCWYNRSSFKITQNVTANKVILNYTVENQSCPNQYACNPTEIIEQGELLSLSRFSCPGITSDCLLVLSPHFNIVTSFVNGGLHISHFDTYFYLNSEKKSVFNRKYFGTLSESGLNREPTFWETFINFWGLDTGEYGLNFSVNKTTNLGSYYAYKYGNSTTEQYYYKRETSAPLNDEGILLDFFNGNTGTLLDTYFPVWVGAQGIRATTTASVDNTSFDITSDIEKTAENLSPFFNNYFDLLDSVLTGSGFTLFDFPTVEINSNRNCQSEYLSCLLYNDAPYCTEQRDICYVEISQPPSSCSPPFMVASSEEGNIFTRVILGFGNVVQMMLATPFPLKNNEYYCLLGTPVKIQYYVWRDNELHWFDYLIMIVCFSSTIGLFSHLIIRNDR